MSEQQTFIVKKELVEAIMDMGEKGAEVVASFTGDFLPVFAFAAPIVRLALDNVESREITFMKEQFQKVHDHLEVLSEEMEKIQEQIKKSGMDARYFSVEEIITNQFRKYMEILEAKTLGLRETHKDLFLEYFDNKGGDDSLHTLYNAVTGHNISGESVLEITMNYEEKDRRVMEDFCARMKKLFYMGLIALLGRTALKCNKNVEPLLKEWKEKMDIVQSKINTVIEDCIVSFPKLAEEYSKEVVKEKPFQSCEELAQALLDKLKERYDWVCWSVRVFKPPRTTFFIKKESHCAIGKSRFTVPCPDDKLNVMVSYSLSPESVDEDRIQKFLQEQKKKSVERKALLLFNQLHGGCVVHIIRTEDLACCHSFSEEQYFWKKHEEVYVCVHSV